ncbi:PQQ-binding-like beta-propeller repeat protein [Verrucomicrobium sp. BvORR034]|uniref:PQQ-binding-like beta-propeller repeat protein n=1 Tax=Verrucomicrobium sp. BvORR034 TaxID=1396418 RepID=UPI0006797812|nr:PQQ-binding-like beta-propeller repeat protein [Verrucomicrobium sp. BvORR034]
MNALVPAQKGHRLWIPVVVAALTAVGIAVTVLKPELDRNFKSWGVSALSLLGGLLLVLWFLLLSRYSVRLRLVSAGLLVLAGFGLSRAVRVDGTVDGTGLPKLAWKWTSPEERHYTQRSGTPVAEVAAVNGVQDVSQFYGPNRDGRVENASLARDWQAQAPKELWRQTIGEGWSAFAVIGGRAYTQEQRGDEEMTTCYELATGRMLWSHAIKARFTQWQGGTGPRATPAVDRGHVYSYGGTGVLTCLDAVTGKEVWSREVLKENNLPNIEWGVSASPLVYDDLVVVTGGDKEGPTVLAYRRDTGEPVWQAGTAKASYASPALVTLAGRRMVLSVNAGNLSAHDPATGELLLDHAWGDPRWPKASQPLVVGEDQVFLSAGYGMGCAMLKIKPAADGKKLEAEEVWQNLRMKTQFNSTALRGKYIYGLDDGQIACMDAETGKRLWKNGRYGSGQSLMVNDLALIQSEPGEVLLVDLEKEGAVLGQLPALSAKTWNHPTLAGKYLLVRNSVEAVCYELPGR